MKKSLVLVSAVLFLIMSFSLAGAASVTVGAESTITVDGTSYTLVSVPPDYSGLMWEVSGTGYKACLCKMTAFRALQALGIYLSNNDLPSAQINITTGWNTDGPEELFVESMPWVEGVNFSYADPITPGSLLTLTDAWYEFSYMGATYKVSSSYDNYRFSPDINHAGYVEDWDFFDYRTYFQTTSGSDPKKNYFSTILRPQIVDNLKGETWFEVSAVPIPGSGWLLGSSLLGLVGMGRRIVRSRDPGIVNLT